MRKIVWMAASLLTLVTSAFGQIGSASSDLVFTPITPCRIVDTRGAGGVIPAATSRIFKGWAANYAAQGGKIDNCGLPQTTDIAALAVNLLVIVPAAEGWIAAWPVGTSMPLVSNLNYKAGDVLANSAILKINQTTADFNVYTVARTHLAMDVTGYYSKPVSAGSMECVVPLLQTVSLGVGFNSYNYATSACSAGYQAVSSFCFKGTAVSVYLTGSGIGSGNSGGAFCGWENLSGAVQTVYQGTNCCRIPGR